MISSRRSFLAASLGAACYGGVRDARSAPGRPPNVVLILCDDLGFGDVGCNGGSLSTPNLDRLAAGGVRFTSGYAASPNCSPSRSALMTGRYAVRTGVPRVLGPKDTIGIHASEVTMARMLKNRGYRTACVGKWHLGRLPEFLPTRHGFDSYFGIPYSNDMSPCILMEDEAVVEDPARLDNLTQRYTERAVRFIESSARDPFFLYMPHTFPHIPLAASPRFAGKSRFGLYGDVVSEVDASVGEILGTIKRLNLGSNTLVVFSSDNGPWFQGSPGRFRGRKHMTWEGGIHVPLIASMPTRIPAGRTCNGVASLIDIYPTVSHLCDAPPGPNPLDGIDIWPLMTGQAQSLERDPILFFENLNLQSARWRGWKLHVARYTSIPDSPIPPGGMLSLPLRPPELYDLAGDPAESYNVADRHPDVVKEMLARVEVRMRTMPEQVRLTYNETMARPTAPQRAGDVPRPEQRIRQ